MVNRAKRASARLRLGAGLTSSGRRSEGTMPINIIVRNYAGLCVVNYYMAYQKSLLLYLDTLAIVEAVNRYGASGI